MLAVYAIAILVIATRQHALGIILHDATHYLVFRDRRVNDIVTDLTCGFPLGLSTELYRRQHVEHHRHTNTELDPYWMQMQVDPDWHWPKPPSAALKLFIGDLFGLNLKSWFAIISHWSMWRLVGEAKCRRSRLAPILFWLAVLALVQTTATWPDFILLWMVPQLTCLNLFVRARSLAEHMGLDQTCELDRTRHVNATWWEQLCISPLHSNYHLDHHLFPSVPLSNLPALHDRLLQDPDYRAGAAIAPGYLSLWSTFAALRPSASTQRPNSRAKLL